MADAIAMARLSLSGDLDRLRILSQNVSNISTTGYRRQIPVSGEFSALIPDAVTEGSTVIPLAVGATDNHPGSIRHTNRALDVSLSGNGYLKVQTPTGEKYTRRGDLHLDNERYLVTSSGNRVLGEGGAIQLGTELIQINSSGEIRDGTNLVGRLAVVEFEDSSSLTYEGDGLLSGGVASHEPANTRIQQGFLEDSNVNPLTEMVQIMEVSRHFAMTGNIASAYDQMLDSAINTLAQL